MQKNNIEKVYYSIGEVARIAGVSPSSLRYWEQNFPELKPQRNAKGTRFYTTANIETARLISYLVRERGMTIKGARHKLKENREETINAWEIVKKLQNIREILTGIKDEMEDTQNENK